MEEGPVLRRLAHSCPTCHFEPGVDKCGHDPKRYDECAGYVKSQCKKPKDEITRDREKKEKKSAKSQKQHYVQGAFEWELKIVLGEIENLLLKKNKAYGNSAFDPIRIFSKANPVEQLNVRIDDKLSRIARGEDAGEDTKFDLLCYLVLKRIAKKLIKD